jgi:hypothetical protein
VQQIIAEKQKDWIFFVRPSFWGKGKQDLDLKKKGAIEGCLPHGERKKKTSQSGGSPPSVAGKKRGGNRAAGGKDISTIPS